MTVVVRKADLKNLTKILTDNFEKKPEKGNLEKHFGKLKRNFDGLDYQIEIRKDEN